MVTHSWPCRELLHICYTGAVTGEELVTSALAIAGDRRFESTRFVLGDWLDYRHSAVRTDDVKTLVAIMKSICKGRPFIKNATVIRPDGTGNAMLAFYKMLTEETLWKVEIFHQYDDAYKWFGVNLSTPIT